MVIKEMAKREQNDRCRVLLDGPYGQANLGDNAIAYCMTKFLTSNGIDVTISCLDPDFIEQTFRVKAVPMLNFRKFQLGPLKNLGDFDAVIIGGGQQLKEYRVPNPFIGMFARVCNMARAARHHDIPFVAWSVGMDWPLSSLAKFLAKRYLGGANCSLILRDGKSFDRANSLLQGTNANVMRNRDVVFMISELTGAISKLKSHRKRVANDNKRLLICPSLGDGAPGFLEDLVRICVEATQEGYEVLGWHSEIRPDYDVRVRTMAEWGRIPGFRWLPNDPIKTEEVVELIGASSLLITTRMHPAIIAVSQHVRAFGIATNEKMRSVFGELRMPYANANATHVLTFQDLVARNFDPSFAMATTFKHEVRCGAEEVLQLIRGIPSMTAEASFN